MKNVVILISGRGSNLRALAEAARRDDWERTLDASIAAVVSSRPDAPGLEQARALGLATETVDHRAYPAREAFEVELARAIDRHAPALVVLAGFMRVLTPRFVNRYEGRMINIHPSLLPAFAGLHTHRQALTAGVKVHGATVHFVTPALDHGPIIAQAVVPVRDGDDEAALAARVLAQEHVILPRAVRWFLEGALRIEAGAVVHVESGAQLVVAAG